MTYVTIFLALLALSFPALQWTLAREKHRQDCFERRYAVYMTVFRLSLFAFGVSVPGCEGISGGQQLIEEAFFSKTQARFLIDKEGYMQLEVIYAEAFWLVNYRKALQELGSRGGPEWREYEDRRLAFESHIDGLYRLFQPYLEASSWLSKKLD